MDFDDFVKVLYGKNVFEDENSEYIKKYIFPFLLPALEKLVRLINDEKEKHKHFKVLPSDFNSLKILPNIENEKNNSNIDELDIKVDIFGTNKLKIKKEELIEIQQEVLKKYIKINPILLLREYLIDEYNKNNKNIEYKNQL